MSGMAMTTLGDLVAERPARARIFEVLGLDYCCGGRRTLADAAAAAGLAVADVERRIVETDAGDGAAARDWRAASPTELTAHLVDTHHVFMKTELPRVAGLLQKVIAAHGARHPELGDLARLYAGFALEIEEHLAKEEQVLFPLIERLTLGAKDFHCGSVQNPIRVMEHEHDVAGAALQQMRAATDGFTAPADGCPTYVALMDGLRAIEADLHEHIHKENNILHPMVVRLERGIAC
jgi:regulator of cell morphogenesis and NO signaling